MIQQSTKANAEMLNYIMQNAEMGKDTIDKLINTVSHVENEDFMNTLQSQMKEYDKIFNEARKILRENDEEIKHVSTMQKMQSDIMIEMKTIKSKNPDHLAEMLIVGSTMGEIQIIRRLREHKNEIKEETYSIGEKLLKTEQANIKEFKRYLGENH